MKFTIAIIVLATFLSCNSNTGNEKSSPKDSSVIDNEISPEEDKERKIAAEWLTSAIEHAFNSETGNIEAICTARYYEFKVDELGVFNGEEDAMSMEEFHRKWSGIYNTKLCKGQAFFLDAQDNGQIRVTANFKSDTPDGYWFSTRIRDEGFKTTYVRDIRIKKNGNSYLVDEVIENESIIE